MGEPPPVSLLSGSRGGLVIGKDNITNQALLKLLNLHRTLLIESTENKRTKFFFCTCTSNKQYGMGLYQRFSVRLSIQTLGMLPSNEILQSPDSSRVYLEVD